MVSNANEDLPEPEGPVKTTNFPRGISRSTLFKLCCRAPRITIERFPKDFGESEGFPAADFPAAPVDAPVDAPGVDFRIRIGFGGIF